MEMTSRGRDRSAGGAVYAAVAPISLRLGLSVLPMPLLACGAHPGPQPAVVVERCPPLGYDVPLLADLKAADFDLGGDGDYDRLALALAECLGSPDPAIRDGIAYEGLFTILRADRVSARTRRALIARLASDLESPAPDPGGFRKPFAALALAEVARTDRVRPFLTPEERAALVEIGADYLASIRDYRGFDDQEGWRHGVAHASDLLMQLALNDSVTAEQHRKMLRAIATQVAPPSVYYVHGESTRLARPVLSIAARETVAPDEWSAWFASVADPAPLAAWDEAFASEAGLARRHDTTAFLHALYVSASRSEAPGVRSLVPRIVEALRRIP